MEDEKTLRAIIKKTVDNGTNRLISRLAASDQSARAHDTLYHGLRDNTAIVEIGQIVRSLEYGASSKGSFPISHHAAVYTSQRVTEMFDNIIVLRKAVELDKREIKDRVISMGEMKGRAINTSGPNALQELKKTRRELSMLIEKPFSNDITEDVFLKNKPQSSSELQSENLPAVAAPNTTGPSGAPRVHFDAPRNNSTKDHTEPPEASRTPPTNTVLQRKRSASTAGFKTAPERDPRAPQASNAVDDPPAPSTIQTDTPMRDANCSIRNYGGEVGYRCLQ